MLRYIIAAFALAFALLATPAVADYHVDEYVVPFVPGAARTAYRNTFIVVTNQQGEPALIDIKAHVNRSVTSVSCGVLDDLAPFEIRRFARNAGTLCVAADEPEDASLRIRTAHGVHVTGYIVLSEARGNGFVPVDVISAEPAAPEGISFSRLTLQALTNRNYRLSVSLRSSSRSWPYEMVACVHARSDDINATHLYDNASHNCSLPNEQLRGWTAPRSPDFNTGELLGILTSEGTSISDVANRDYSHNLRRPPIFRVCIHQAPDEGILPAPFLCDEVRAGSPAAAQQDESAPAGS